jgi:ArsR family transcriptional regulator, arsenate/arsenite/antimonite-responsive transcriptional repressor
MPDTVEVFKGLSDRTRLRITTLLTHGELCVCDLMEILALPQSTISRHMARLKSAGIVQDRRAGKWVYYSLQNGGFPENIRRFFLKELSGEDPYLSDLKKREKHLATKNLCK